MDKLYNFVYLILNAKMYHNKSVIFKKLLLFTFCIQGILIAKAQSCVGSWSNDPGLNYGCMVGKWIGQFNGNSEPLGCPINPVYTAGQTNTFTFAATVSGFTIDLQSFTTMTGCARLEVKINGVFYPLTNVNLMDISPELGCAGSFSFIALTNEGYITSGEGSTTFTGGRARIIITEVNANSVTISTNDPAGTIVSTPFNCTSVVPVILESFAATHLADCKIILNWKTGTEFNIKNIQVQQSADGILFHEIGEVNPKGNNSDYSFSTAALSDSYFMLKTNDLDGNYQYSEIIYIKSTCNTAIYQIIPNPAADFIEIIGLKKYDQVLLTDMAGRHVLYFDTPVGNKLNIQSLTAGIYFIQVINKGIQIAISKLIKS